MIADTGAGSDSERLPANTAPLEINYLPPTLKDDSAMKRPTRALMVMALAFGSLLGWLVASGQFHSPHLTAAELQTDTKTPDMLDRTVLPIPEPKPVPITTLDARNAKAPPRFEVKAPKAHPTC